MMKPPSERARIYFLLAWFHAVVQERLRYAPLGWSKGYEFNESDLRVACDTLDTWIEATAMVSAMTARDDTWIEAIAMVNDVVGSGRWSGKRHGAAVKVGLWFTGPGALVREVNNCRRRINWSFSFCYDRKSGEKVKRQRFS